MPMVLSKFPHARVLVFTLLATVALGTLLLALPICQRVPIGFFDLLFTATSATCVTGLLTIPLSDFSLLGQGIILALIQIGGLGLITLSLFLFSLVVRFDFSTQLIAGQFLELETWKKARDVLTFIILFTVCIELLGAGIIYAFFPATDQTTPTLFLSIFHAISSFCDAGFSNLPGGIPSIQKNPFMIIVTALLMFCGGFGFLTWFECYEYLKAKREHKRFKFSLQSKIIVYTTFSMIATSSILFWILERHNAFADLPNSLVWLNSVFSAVSIRSCGFLTTSPLQLQFATLFIIMIVSFIGSSPGSTGSGIKITTLAILVATAKAVLIKREQVQIKGRSIAIDQVYKAFAILGLSIGWILLTIFCLLITEKGLEFFDIVLEVISAFSTLGISLNITPHLSLVGKFFILLSMIFGRLGALTIILALIPTVKKTEFSYPEERIMIG